MVKKSMLEMNTNYLQIVHIITRKNIKNGIHRFVTIITLLRKLTIPMILKYENRVELLSVNEK